MVKQCFCKNKLVEGIVSDKEECGHKRVRLAMRWWLTTSSVLLSFSWSHLFMVLESTSCGPFTLGSHSSPTALSTANPC